MMVMREVNSNVYTKEYFEGDCEGWVEWVQTSGKKLAPRLKYALDMAGVKPGDVVVDFGSGRGELAFHVANIGAMVLGLDYSATAIKLSKKLPSPKSGSLDFERIKSLRIPKRDGSVDLIFFVDVIEHLYPEQLDELFNEFSRVLKPGGKIIVHTAPNREYYDYGYPFFTRWMNIVLNQFLWKPFFRDELIVRKNPRTKYDYQVHVNECSKDELEDYFTKSGFDVKAWYDSSWRKIRIRDKVEYLINRPAWGPLKRWFAYDIWAVATKV